MGSLFEILKLFGNFSGVRTTRPSSYVGRYCDRSCAGVSDGIDCQLYLWAVVSIHYHYQVIYVFHF
jgi:hypothetical protein